MIHEIAPHKLDNEFKTIAPKPTDYLIIFNGEQTLFKKDGDNYVIPRVSDFPQCECHYLIGIDDSAYFLCNTNLPDVPEGYEFRGNRTFRTLANHLERLGGATAAHIAKWESLNKFCGKCGCMMKRSNGERAMVCPACKNTVYPKISPVVIVAVRNGNELLMARNLDNPDKTRMFLISGFVEIGESLEQAVKREVLEEAGVHVKNIKYFGSQPWPFSESMISGFTAELDGDPTIHMQASELACATWVKREDIPEYDTSVSISSCLIENFRSGWTIKEE